MIALLAPVLCFADTGLNQSAMLAKDELLKQVDLTNTTVLQKIKQLQKVYSTNNQYMMLKCLGLANLDILWSWLTLSGNLLKQDLLNQYVNITSKIFEYDNKKNLGLISAEEAGSLFAAIQSAILSYQNSWMLTITKLGIEQTSAVNNAENDLLKYMQSNSTLLDTLARKQQTLQTIFDAFASFQLDSQEFILNTLGQFSGQFESGKQTPLQEFEKALTNLLQWRTSAIIDIPGAYNKASDQKKLLMIEATDMLSKFVNGLLTSVTDQSTLNSVTNDITSLRSNYYSNWSYQCVAILNSTQDIDGLLLSIQQRINLLRQQLQEKKQSFTSADALDTFIRSLNSQLIAYQQQLLKETLAKLSLYIGKMQSNADAQRAKVQPLFEEQVARKTNVLDNPRVSAAGKERTRSSIIASGNALIDQAPTYTTKNLIIRFLQSIWASNLRVLAPEYVFVPNPMMVQQVINILTQLSKSADPATFRDKLTEIISKIDTILSTTVMDRRKEEIYRNIREGVIKFMQN